MGPAKPSLAGALANESSNPAKAANKQFENVDAIKETIESAAAAF